MEKIEKQFDAVAYMRQQRDKLSKIILYLIF